MLENNFFVEYWVPTLESAMFEGTRDQVLEFLKRNPHPTYMDIINEFGDPIDYETLSCGSVEDESLSITDYKDRTIWTANAGLEPQEASIIPITNIVTDEQNDIPGEANSKLRRDEEMPESEELG